nr:hypothetical protein [Echinicola strongylocentroti]
MKRWAFGIRFFSLSQLEAALPRGFDGWWQWEHRIQDMCVDMDCLTSEYQFLYNIKIGKQLFFSSVRIYA